MIKILKELKIIQKSDKKQIKEYNLKRIENKLYNQINNDNKLNKNEDKKSLYKKIKIEKKEDNKNKLENIKEY